MTALKRLIREAHRRSLWQIVLFYVAAAWVVLQVAEHVVEQFGLPEWTYGAAVLLLLIGLPIVTATAFVQEGVGSADQADSTAGDRSGGARGVPTDTAAAGVPGPGPEVAAADAPGSAIAAADSSDLAGHQSGHPNRPAGGTPAPRRGRPGGLLTWRNAILGGVGAFALLGVSLGGYLIMRSAGIGSAGTLVAKGVLDDQAKILVADFGAPSGEETLSRTVTEAFRIDFSESPVVRVADPSQVGAALRRMERAPDTVLDPELAGELALREGIAAVVVGEIGAAGSGYLLSARLVDADDGTVLVSHRESASDADELVPAIDRLSKRLRERIGESLGSLAGSRPLERVTTASMEALEKYSEAVDAMEKEGNLARGIALLEEAVAIDSTFAMAHRKLGIALYVRREERARQIEEFRKAFEYRDRLSDSERYIAEATYYTYGTGELEKAVTAYENLLAEDPENHTGLNNLALVYDALGDHERAVDLLERALATDSTLTNPYTNGMFALLSLGRPADAKRLLDEMNARFPTNPRVDQDGWFLHGAIGEYEEAGRYLDKLEVENPESRALQAEAAFGKGAVASTLGQLAEAEAQLRRQKEIQAERELPAQYLNAALDLAWTRLAVRRDPGGAVSALEEALAEQPLEEVAPYERPYASIVSLYARAGRPDAARPYMEALDEEVWPLAQGDPAVQWRYHTARGDLALANGAFEEAIQAYRRIDDRFCELCQLLPLADGFDAAGEADSATVYYERYVTTPEGNRIMADRLWLPSSYERLGQLHDERGDLEKAAEYYAKFVELWADADEELQPRVRAAQERLEEIVRERG